MTHEEFIHAISRADYRLKAEIEGTTLTVREGKWYQTWQLPTFKELGAVEVRAIVTYFNRRRPLRSRKKTP